MNAKIGTTHLTRRAIVYARQSTLKQLYEHRESTARQYGLRDRAVELGWDPEQVVVVDEDLGQSGASASWRPGFQRLAEDVAQGRIGAIFALEVSRLARSSADWHRLLELCRLADVVIGDEQAAYDPKDYNDRLLLGLKGTMSEAEQHWMRLRLEGGRLAKARRGEMAFCPPAGYQWDAVSLRFRLDPDQQVQQAIRLVFERFRLDGSGYAVTRYFAKAGLRLPARELATRELRWVLPRHTLVLSILHNPIYAGAYVFGRKEERMGLVNGELRRRVMRRLPQSSWKVVLKDRHPAYISWEEFMANQDKISENRTLPASANVRGAAREGRGLLQGLTLCGRCGRRMATRYPGTGARTQYFCRPNHATLGASCWTVSGQAIDRAVEELFLAAVQPPIIELALAVAQETERQASELDRQWTLRIDRLRYEALLAERRYKAVDPDNRVVARTLEGEWEGRLRELQAAEREHLEARERLKLQPTAEDRARILALARDLPTVWKAPSTTNAERKNLLRMAIREVTLTPVDVPERTTRIQVLWQSGATSELALPRPLQGRATSEETVEAIRDLFVRGKDDEEIARELNRGGARREKGQLWDVASVQRVRYKHGLFPPSPRSRGKRTEDQRSDGLYSVRGVAHALDVPHGTVRGWIRSGLLEPAEGGGTGHPLWFRLDQTTLERLQTCMNGRRDRVDPWDLVSGEGAL
jgi:DNA invertase Pin-like site-specific DNA recombinase